ncbi:hypothetical protein [Halalkalicoccus sp. NIPERK01]|uniref:hypothetical protein n=1 Tax=Halalkalicoccus sp. NIPERK01 TaxID=3053469 RepID=UPI00256EBB2E|nr:hypothetical protein [Halalkalicoccus sp. NIPERK01]MDL5363428.1 hypothetical protein [Halalkalicoccus sp. NIPERK01]
MQVSNQMRRWGGTFLLLALVIIISSGIYITITVEDQFAALTAILLASILFPLYLSLRASRFELFEPIIFHSIFFTMIVIGWIERVYVTRTDISYEFVNRTFTEGFLLVGIVLLVLFVSIMAGYYTLGPAVAQWFENRGHTIQTILQTVSPSSGRAFRVVGGGYILIGLLSILSAILLVFPPGEIFYLYTTTEPRSEVFAENGVFILFSRALYIGYLLWLSGAIMDGRTPSMIEFASAIPFAGAFLLLGGRGRAVSIIIIAIIFFYYSVIEDLFSLERGDFARLTKHVPPGVLIVCLPIVGLVMAIGIVLLRVIRLSQSPIEALTSINPFSILTAGVHTGIYDNFLGLVEIVPEQVGYFYGLFYARVPLNFVPRSIWPEKPVSTSGGLFRRIALPDASGGRPPGAMGEYYLNFGYPGIPLMGALYGILLYLTWQLINRDRVSVLSFVVFTLLLITIGKNGLVNNTLFPLVSDLVLLIPALFFLMGWQRISSPTVYSRHHDES